MSVQIHDNGGTANGGVDTSAAQTFTITVTAVNDAPVDSVPGPQTTHQGTPLTFSVANANRPTVTDIDIASGNVTVTVGVAHGTLTLGSTVGVTVTGNGTASVQVTGVPSSVNNALDGLVYAPTSGYSGPDTLTMLSNDNGNTGSGGAKTDSDTVAITVTPNLSPTANADLYSTPEDTASRAPGSGAGSPAANDTDPENDTLAVSAVSSPVGGSVVLAAGQITFTPTADLCGPARASSGTRLSTATAAPPMAWSWSTSPASTTPRWVWPTRTPSPRTTRCPWRRLASSAMTPTPTATP